jgi:methionyl-tRNA formyltransferase
VLSAYGHILSKTVLELARLGGINIHPSLLPRYRGAAPIQRAIMAGEERTGITIFFMDEKVDHGEVIAQREIPIEKDDTYGSLADKLAHLGAEMIAGIIQRVNSDSHERAKQQEEKASYAPKIKKQEFFINWEQAAEKVYNHIRALLPRPVARTHFRQRELMITRAQLGDRKLSPRVLSVEDKRLYVGAGNGSIELLEVKPEGRKAMSARDFINGYHIQEGEVLG